MIAKVVVKRPLNADSEIRENLRYWLSRTAEERVAAVELLRRQRHGSSGRLQRVAHIIQLPRS